MVSVSDVKSHKGLRLIHINCRSIVNKIDEIRYVFEGVDILACTETWLYDAIPNYMIDIPSMDLFRYDRNTKSRGGGVACYISRNLKINVSVVPTLSHCDTNIEILTLKCVYLFGKIFHIVVVYRPPNGSYSEFFAVLSNHLDTGLLTDHDLYICGDLNIDYLQRNDIKTKSMISFLRTYGLKQYIQNPTRLTGFSKSCIDYIITNIPESTISKAGILVEVISDHFPIFMCIKKKRNHAEYCKIKGRTYKKYDKTLLQNLILLEDWTYYYNLTNTAELWNFIMTLIQKHLDIMCPIKLIRIRKNSPPWITHEIVEAINDRNCSFKQAYNNNTEVNIKNARVQRNRVNKLITSSKANYIKDTLDNNRDNPKKFWRILNENLLKGNKECSDIVFLQGDDTPTMIDMSCEYMNNHLADVGVKLYDQFKNVMDGMDYNLQ